MGLPNKAEIRGKINKAKGTVRENVGRAVGNRRMENEGAAEAALVGEGVTELPRRDSNPRPGD